MKKLVLIAGLLLSTTVFAQSQCKVDIQNEVHLDGDSVEIYQQDTPKVLIDENNNLFINGKKMELSASQQQALESYRANLNEYLPRAREIARSGLALVEEILNDMAASFNNSEAFNNVKEALEEFLRGLESRYYKDDEMILQQAAFADAFSHWQEDLAAARESFNAEFMTSAFSLLMEQMKTEGGVDIMALKEKALEVYASMDDKVKADSVEIQKEAEQYCDDVEKVAEEEKALHEKIPELKDYQVFLI